MKRFRFRPRTWIVLGVVTIVAAAAAIGGYAYFTAAGSGTGYAQTGSVANLSITSTVPTGIWPDGTDHAITVVVQNTGGGPQYINTISGSVATFPGCWGYWFQVDPISVNATVPVGFSSFSTNMRMPVDTTDDQTACAGQTLTINWTSN
jgi:hypothetical protein